MTRSRVPSRLALPSCRTSAAVWKKRTGIPCRVASMPRAVATCVLPRPVGPWKTRSSARPTKSSESISSRPPALGEAHVRPVEPLDGLGHGEPRLAQQPRPLGPLPGLELPGQHPRAGGELTGRSGLEEPCHRRLRYEQRPGARGELLALGVRDPRHLRRPPSGSSKARSYPARSTGSSYSTSASPAAALAAASSRVAASTPPRGPERPQRALHGGGPAPPGAHVAQRPEVRAEVGGRLRVEEGHELLGQGPPHDAVAPARRGGSRAASAAGSGPRSRSARRPTRAGTRRRPRPPAPTTVTSKAPIATATSREALAGPRRVAVLAARPERALLVAPPGEPP